MRTFAQDVKKFISLAQNPRDFPENINVLLVGVHIIRGVSGVLSALRVPEFGLVGNASRENRLRMKAGAIIIIIHHCLLNGGVIGLRLTVVSSVDCVVFVLYFVRHTWLTDVEVATLGYEMLS